MEAKDKIAAAMAALGLTVASEFVPFSKSRNAANDPDGTAPRKRSLNWRVTLKHNGADVLTTDYGAGIAHAPSYDRLKIGHSMGHLTLEQAEALIYETQKGKRAPISPSVPIGGPAILPDPVNVVYSLVRDAEAIDFPTFEDWAREYGLDADSRKEEASYRACLETGLKLRAAIGEAGLEQLREAGEGY